MTTEISKMFENAGIKAMARTKEVRHNLFECGLFYPDFTAKKQLKIVKFLLRKGDYYDTDGVYYDTDGDTYWFHFTDEIENVAYRPFEEAIAEFINTLWQSLTNQDKEEIRRILNDRD